MLEPSWQSENREPRSPWPRRRSGRKFPGASFGPVHLRQLLRTHLSNDERPVGWALAFEHPGPFRAAAALAWFAVPVVGQLVVALDAAMLVSRRRVVVLTDRRLLLLHPSCRGARPCGGGVVTNANLGSITVERSRQRADDPDNPDASCFRIEAGGRTHNLLVREQDRTASSRLVEALATLAASPVAGSGLAVC